MSDFRIYKKHLTAYNDEYRVVYGITIPVLKE